jgi:hypothetical protein
MMLPTCDQVQRAAYERWMRRGRIHGYDRADWYAAEKELSFLLHYETIVDYRLDDDDRLVLGDRPVRRCRFCERTSRQAAFSCPQPAVPGPLGTGSLRTAEICDECQAECRDPLAEDFLRLWDALRAGPACFEGGQGSRRPDLFSVAAFKSLIAAALLLMPEDELGYFPDALEWVSNPDQGCDLSLFGESSCRVYRAPFLGRRAWTSLARRVDTDDRTTLPYMLLFLGGDGIIIQVHVPLCLRDEDLDGQRLCLPERALTGGEGPDFREAPCQTLPLALTVGRSRPRAGPIFPES